MSDSAAAESESPGSRRIWVAGLLTLGVLTAAICFLPMLTAPLQGLWFDALQRVEPRNIESTPAVIVQIDESSLTALGQWPWPRTLLAELMRDIEQYQPLAIGVDIWMPEVDRLSPQYLLVAARMHDPVLEERLAGLPSNDAELASAIGAGRVVLGMIASRDATGKTLRAPPFLVSDAAKRADAPTTALNIGHFNGVLTNIDELEQAASGHGLLSVGDPENGIIRRIPLVTDIHSTLTPALSIEMLRVALQAPVLRLHVAGSAVQAVSIGNFTLPTEEDGAVRIYYSNRDARRHVSAQDVLNGKVDPQSLRNKLVLVAVTGVAATDYHGTPLGEAMLGSEIHAQLLENVYDHTWLKRPTSASALELIVFVLLGLLLIWATPRWKPRNSFFLATACVLLPAVAAYAAFRSQRQLYDAATTGVGLLILFFVLLVLTLAEAARRRKSLELVVQKQRVQAAYISGELQAAQRIQTGILPRAESLRDEHRIDLAATMTPAREVGGDLYDFFRLDADRLFFMVGDVAGKGLSASIFMVISKALYKSVTLRRPDATISEVMRAANEEVSRDNPEMLFVTAFAGILDLESGELTYCNAGHENPYLVDTEQSTFTRLEAGAGPPLCAVEGFAYDAGTHPMRPGELLCIVTDGVVDSQNPAGQRYGNEHLQAVVARLRETAHAAVDAVSNNVRTFASTAEPADDITVLALRWLGPAARRT